MSVGASHTLIRNRAAKKTSFKRRSYTIPRVEEPYQLHMAQSSTAETEDKSKWKLNGKKKLKEPHMFSFGSAVFTMEKWNKSNP